MTQAHLDGTFHARRVAAIKHDGFLSIHANGARFLLVETLSLHLQATKLCLNALNFILLKQMNKIMVMSSGAEGCRYLYRYRGRRKQKEIFNELD